MFCHNCGLLKIRVSVVQIRPWVPSLDYGVDSAVLLARRRLANYAKNGVLASQPLGNANSTMRICEANYANPISVTAVKLLHRTDFCRRPPT